MAQVVAQLLKDLHVTEVQDGNAGKLVWLPSPNKGFQMKSYYHVLRVDRQISHGRVFGSPCSAEGGILFLVCGSGRVLTINNKRKQGIIIMKWRFMCKSHGEDVNHLNFTLFCGLGDVVYDI